MQRDNQADAVIVGAGLTGLTTAYYLKKKGLDVVVIEKDQHPGGVIQTFREDGFVYEAGPNTGVLSQPEVAELFEELDGSCRLEIANPEAKRRLIWKSGSWHALPGGPVSALKTPLFSFRDKFGILGEPFRAKGKDPLETLEKMVIRRLGRSYLDYAVDPFISGIYAGDPSRLVTKYALPKLYALEQNYGSFIRGAIKKRSEPKDERTQKATKEVFSAEWGLGSLIDALVSQLGGERIWTGVSGASVARAGDEFEVSVPVNGGVRKIRTPHVISTIDAPRLPELFPFIDKASFADILNLEYSAVVQVIAGFKNWKGMNLNAFGGLVPSKEHRDILGVLFTSSFFKNRVPEGGALLSVFLGGYRRPELAELTDAETEKLVLREIREMLGVEDPDPALFRIFRYRRAIPQYGKTSKERLEAISRIQEQHPGLCLAGAVREGIGMADRIKQARDIAGAVAENQQQF